ARKLSCHRVGSKMRCQHDLLESRNSANNLFDVRKNIELLTFVDVPVGGEQYLRFDLAETIQDGGGTQLRAATGPDGTDACGCKHRDDRFLNVWQVARHAVSRSNPHLAESIS